MKTEYHKQYSNCLGRDMEFKVYGHAGRPVLIFPTSCGRFYQYEDFGMTEVCRPFIDEGRIQLYCIDGIDEETWHDHSGRHPYDRIQRHEQYYHYVMDEFVPHIQHMSHMANGGEYRGGIITSGCSMGGFHSANFFFRRPDVFDGLIAISGLYRSQSFMGDYLDEATYYNSVLNYLPNMNDEGTMDLYRRSRIIVCCGQGAWEDEMLKDTIDLKGVLEHKGIPAWVDIWGHDVNHDWPWWRIMMPYFLGHILA